MLVPYALIKTILQPYFTTIKHKVHYIFTRIPFVYQTLVTSLTQSCFLHPIDKIVLFQNRLKNRL